MPQQPDTTTDQEAETPTPATPKPRSDSPTASHRRRMAVRKW